MGLEEHELMRRLDEAEPDEFAALLAHPSGTEEDIFRDFFGDDRYDRLHGLALRAGMMRGVERRSNLVIVHGIMGAQLSAHSIDARDRKVWVNPLRLVLGDFAHLHLSDDGRSEIDPSWTVTATGILKRYYGEQLLALSPYYQIRAFWFDWRKDVKLAAAELDAKIESWFDESRPTHIVAHSMGGLVARAFMHRYGSARLKGGRLVMLGTPYRGSFSVPLIMTGIDPLIGLLATLDLDHSREELLSIVNSFPGLYQMLPWPDNESERARIYSAASYDSVPGVTQRQLEAGREFHEWLANEDRHSATDRPDEEQHDGARSPHEAPHEGGRRPIEAQNAEDRSTVFQILGFGHRTPASLALGDCPSKLGSSDAYRFDYAGDGRVHRSLGEIGFGTTYYAPVRHEDLPVSDLILPAVVDLLENGAFESGTTTLPTDPAQCCEAGAAAATGEGRRSDVARVGEGDRQRCEKYARRTRSRGITSEEDDDRAAIDDRMIEETLVRGFLSSTPDARVTSSPAPQSRRIPISIRFAHARIEDIDGGLDESGRPVAFGTGAGDDPLARVDALAVGHYTGVKPQLAELDLDTTISKTLKVETGKSDAGVLTQFAERGTVSGELGRPFIITDPRESARAGADRVIVLAGMGLPGRFGAPELVVLVRELVWTLGRLGKRHLATVVIGLEKANMKTQEAAPAWLSGLAEALHSDIADEGDIVADDQAIGRIVRVTFVDRDYANLVKFRSEIIELDNRGFEHDRLAIDVAPCPREDSDLTKAGRTRGELQARRQVGRVPTQVTVELKGRAYRFGAITHDASIPERSVILDPDLVAEANDELISGAGDLVSDLAEEKRVQQGQLLERLLIPRDFRRHITPDNPLVLMVDATTARIHWEMVAEPPRTEPGARAAANRLPFLGLCRGLTRQLRTTFAPPPDPAPPLRRVLRVLVIADPASDARLTGAEEEGIEVADLFESFNRVHDETENRVEVTRLLGPKAASRTNVLRHLMLGRYDVVHYAGHCHYDDDDPAGSGWLFGGGEKLSSYELGRVDQMPPFVFSNACQSGVTPDRLEDRDAGMAPSFAETFFARGVSNFVCTAWPVNDNAARVFARELYSQLLGLKESPDKPGLYVKKNWSEEMYLAMQNARLRCQESPDGKRTWGAYQHYGNPYFRLLHPDALKNRRAAHEARRSALARSGSSHGQST